MEYYEDSDYLDAVIFRAEKNYEDCDTRVDMSWAEHNNPYFIDDEWCILEKLIVSNSVTGTKLYNYVSYRLLDQTSWSQQNVQRLVEKLNSNLKEDPNLQYKKSFNGCSIKVISYLWGISGISGDCKVRLRPDGDHHSPIDDPFSVEIILPFGSPSGPRWINFDPIIVPPKWQKLSQHDFLQRLFYNPFTNQASTYIDHQNDHP